MSILNKDDGLWVCTLHIKERMKQVSYNEYKSLFSPFSFWLYKYIRFQCPQSCTQTQCMWWYNLSKSAEITWILSCNMYNYEIATILRYNLLLLLWVSSSSFCSLFTLFTLSTVIDILQRSLDLLLQSRKTIYFLNATTLFNVQGDRSICLNDSSFLSLVRRLRFLDSIFQGILQPEHKVLHY